MFKGIKKSKSTSYDDLSRQIYGTPNNAGNLEKLNAGVTSGEILFPEPDDDTESTGDGLRVEIGGETLTDFPEYTLIDSLGAIKGAVLIFVRTDKKYKFNFKDSIKIFDNSGLFLKGRIANIKPASDVRAKWVQVEIKSDAGVLNETALPYPLEFQNLTLKQILNQICGYYGTKIEFSDAAELDSLVQTEIGTSAAARLNETTFDFMFRLCKAKGLLLTDTGDGLFVGRLTDDKKEKINFIESECKGIASIHSEFKTDGLGRYYELNSQYPTTDSATVAIPFPLPVTKRVESNDFNSRDLENIATRYACDEIGKAFKTYITLNETMALKSGNLVVVQSESAFIDEETTFVIETVIQDESDKTQIVLTLPCKYTGVIPDKLPLC